MTPPPSAAYECRSILVRRVCRGCARRPSAMCQADMGSSTENFIPATRVRGAPGGGLSQLSAGTPKLLLTAGKHTRVALKTQVRKFSESVGKLVEIHLCEHLRCSILAS